MTLSIILLRSLIKAWEGSRRLSSLHDCHWGVYMLYNVRTDHAAPWQIVGLKRKMSPNKGLRKILLYHLMYLFCTFACQFLNNFWLFGNKELSRINVITIYNAFYNKNKYRLCNLLPTVQLSIDFKHQCTIGVNTMNKQNKINSNINQ